MSAILELVKVADESGVDSVWVTEELFKWDAFTILGSLASGTSRVRLGPGVTSPYVRPPHLQAMSSATLNRLSQGRAFLGLGRGVTDWYSNLLGKDVTKPVTLMRETIHSIRRYWAYINDAHTEKANRVPIYVAAIGPKMLNVAADLADGVVFAWPTFQFLQHNIEAITLRARKNPQQSSKDLAFFVHTGFCVTSNTDEAFGSFKDQMSVIHSMPGLELALMSDDYDIPKIIGKIRGVMKTPASIAKGGRMEDFHSSSDFAIARKAIPNGLVNQVAIAGNADAVRLRLAQYESIGVTHVFMPPPWGQTSTQFHQLLNSINPKPTGF